jgi:predicted GIY-YIG superfamily endonuclease
MAESKTKQTTVSAAQFIAKVPDASQRADAETLVRIFQRATGEQPVMWGPSIVGFGKYHYVYESGREGDMCLAGFSPRSAALALYVLSGATGEDALLARLGKHTTGKGCLYVKRVADVDEKVLEELVRVSAAHTRERQQCDKCVTDRAEKKVIRTAAKKKPPAKKTRTARA